MKESEKGRELHGLAESLREKGEFENALEHTDNATIAYVEDGDVRGLAEVQSSRQLTFGHLYYETGAPEYRILQKHAAMAAVEIAELSGEPEALGIPYFNLGKYYFDANEYRSAEEYFKKAVENLSTVPNSRHGRPSVIADVKGHLHVAEYYLGDKSALEKSLKALEDLEKAEEASYEKNVWMSGAHLRIANMIKNDQTDLAQHHLQKAKEIIDSDERLVLRKKQLDKLEQQFK